MEVNELFKHRSITACMRASYDTITSDFRSLVKQTWTTHVPFAVLLAIVLYFLLPNKPLHDWGAVNPMASFILQTIIYGATIVMAIVSFWHLLPRKQLCPKGKKTQDRKIPPPHSPPLRWFLSDQFSRHDYRRHRYLYRSPAFHHPHHRTVLFTARCT